MLQMGEPPLQTPEGRRFNSRFYSPGNECENLWSTKGGRLQDDPRKMLQGILTGSEGSVPAFLFHRCCQQDNSTSCPPDIPHLSFSVRGEFHSLWEPVLRERKPAALLLRWTTNLRPGLCRAGQWNLDVAVWLRPGSARPERDPAGL